MSQEFQKIISLLSRWSENLKLELSFRIPKDIKVYEVNVQSSICQNILDQIKQGKIRDEHELLKTFKDRINFYKSIDQESRLARQEYSLTWYQSALPIFTEMIRGAKV